MCWSEKGQRFYEGSSFRRKDMLTDRAKIHFHNRLKDIEREQLTPYAGHDTVGIGGIGRIWRYGRRNINERTLYEEAGACRDLSIYRIWIICRQHDWWRDVNGSWRGLDEGREFRMKSSV